MRRALISLLLLAAGCDGALELSIDLRTDLRPGLELDAVEVRWADAQGVTIGSRMIAATDRDFIVGERLADVEGLAPGTYTIRVTLLDGGTPVATRETLVDLRASTAVTVLITRDCGGVTCPGADPQLTACLDGRCVDPACRPGAPDACPPPSCGTAIDCPAPSVACVRAECVARACFEVPDDTRCAPGQLCDPALGCVGDAPPEDGGPPPPPRDAGPCVSTELLCADGLDQDCDGATDCADPDCAGATCDDGDPCTFGDACGGGGCAGTPITCVDDECVTRSCNGTASCAESTRADGVACTDDGSPCTSDVCSGGVCSHPARTGSCTDDGNPCTSDVCSGGVCAHPARTGSCTDDGNPCTSDVCSGGICAHPALADGTSLGGFSRCCGGAPTDVSSDRNNCGACGLTCSGSYACTVYAGQPTCDCATANSECHGGSGFLCSTSYGVCACLSDAACPGSARCVARSGAPDYCTY